MRNARNVVGTSTSFLTGNGINDMGAELPVMMTGSSCGIVDNILGHAREM